VARQGRVSPKERIRQLLGTFWWPAPAGVISRSNTKATRGSPSVFCGNSRKVDNNSWKAEVSNEPDAFTASAKRVQAADAAWGHVLSEGA
jgi:hypothetical protein